ncbi:MAG: ABC transporter permease [Gaiellaceae bacterium]
MIRSVRARKVVGDLGASKARSALVVLSIAIGVTAVGTVVGARALMGDSLAAAREEGRFPAATLRTDPLHPALLARLRELPGVETLEARRLVAVRLDAGGRRLELTLTAASFESARLARIRPERGAWPPPAGGLLLERDSLAVAGLRAGDVARVTAPGGETRPLLVAGTVHDVTPPSASTSGVLSGYVTPETLRAIGYDRGPNQLHLAVAEGAGHAEARRVAAAARAEIERSGRAVLAATVPEPGRFWAQDQVDAMVLLLTVLGGVALLMSGFLVANSVSALVAEQLRQIGVMKAVGAGGGDTAAVYVGIALVLGLLALAVSVPLGAVAAATLAGYAAGLVNLDPAPFRIALEAVALQVAAGLLVPVVAALGPVLSASRVTVREAVASQGLGGVGGAAVVAGLARRAAAIPATVRLSLANALRRPHRLVLTLAALVLAGTALLAVLSVRSSLDRTLDNGSRYRAYDVAIELDRPTPVEDVERAVAAEAWAVGSAHVGEGDTFTVLGAPQGTTLVRPFVIEGRWLRPGDKRVLVVNDQLLDAEPGLRPGAETTLSLDGRAGTWRVVGVVRGLLEGPLAYAPAAEIGDARRVLAAGGAAQGLAERLEAAGIPVASVVTAAERRALDEKNYGTLVSFLLVMAVLLAVVGGLGLAGALGLGVIERTRELGVLRAIGAGDADVARLVLAEGVAVAAVGALVAVPLSLPAGRALAEAVGELFLGGPPAYAFATWGAVAWLGIALAVALVAGLLPALRAARLPVRELVAYE